MNNTEREIISFVQENDVKFIRLAFCDIFGIQKNISIMPGELVRAFEAGIPFDASSVASFMNVGDADLLLVPDASTLSILPWRPSHGRVVRMFCDIKRPDGSAFEGDTRNLLKRAVAELEKSGLSCRIGLESEFYLFKLGDNEEPTLTPHDNGSFCDIVPMDKGENIRREICLTLEEMGIMPEKSHHEQGPGQNEIVFCQFDAPAAADSLVAFKAVVKSIAAKNGLFASFMPKPLPDKSGSGLHIHLSVARGGKSLFERAGGDISKEGQSFVAGILERISEITAFLNPTTNSYERFGSFEAPKYVTWDWFNRSQLIRIHSVENVCSRVELRSADCSCNPHLAFAMVLLAGLEGIKKNLALCAPTELAAAAENGSQLLPSNLEEALRLAKGSDFVKSFVPEKLLSKYFEIKKTECEKRMEAGNARQFEHDFYFPNI